MANSYLTNMVMDDDRPLVLRYLDAIFYLTDEFVFATDISQLTREKPWLESKDVTACLLRQLDQEQPSNEIQRYKMLLEHAGASPYPVQLAQWNYAATVISLTAEARKFHASMVKYHDFIEQVSDLQKVVETLEKCDTNELLAHDFVMERRQRLDLIVNQGSSHDTDNKHILSDAHLEINKLLVEAYSGRKEAELVFSPLHMFGINFEANTLEPVTKTAVWLSDALKLPIINAEAEEHIGYMRKAGEGTTQRIEANPNLAELETLWKAIAKVFEEAPSIDKKAD